MTLLGAAVLAAASCGGSKSIDTPGGGTGGMPSGTGGGPAESDAGQPSGGHGGAPQGSGGAAGGAPIDGGIDLTLDTGAPDHEGGGGTPPGSGGGGVPGSGGVTGASGGASGVAGAGGGVSPASPGCRLATAQPAERVADSTVMLELVRKFPPGYDGVTPMPLIFALHATNYQATGMVTYLTKDQPMAARYVIVAPQEKQQNPSNFESHQPIDFSKMLANVLAELCIDQTRMFGVGNGSGGRAVDRWIGYLTGPNSYPVVPPLRAFGMVGTYITNGGGSPRPIPTIFIHPLFSSNSRGVAQDEDGLKALNRFRVRNGCGESSVPVTAATCAVGATTVANPGCVDFDGCVEPLRFCHHDDLSGQSGGDPWSCVASPALYQFFATYL